jgi:hypothetical protein
MNFPSNPLLGFLRITMKYLDESRNKDVAAGSFLHYQGFLLLVFLSFFLQDSFGSFFIFLQYSIDQDCAKDEKGKHIGNKIEGKGKKIQTCILKRILVRKE